MTLSPGRVTALVALLSIAAATGCSSGPIDPAEAETFPEEALLTVSTDGGDVLLEVRTAPQPPSRGPAEVEYRILDSEGTPQDGLAIEVTPWMVDMGHGTSTAPVVEPEGEGRYRVSGFDFVMAGRWELRTEIDGQVRDHATVPLQIP